MKEPITNNPIYNTFLLGISVYESVEAAKNHKKVDPLCMFDITSPALPAVGEHIRLRVPDIFVADAIVVERGYMLQVDYGDEEQVEIDAPDMGSVEAWQGLLFVSLRVGIVPKTSYRIGEGNPLVMAP